MIRQLMVDVGGKVSAGSLIALVDANGEEAASTAEPSRIVPLAASAPVLVHLSGDAGGAPPRNVTCASQQLCASTLLPARTDATVYASPGVRKLARELGVPLSRMAGTAAKGRVIAEDEFHPPPVCCPRRAAPGCPGVGGHGHARCGAHRRSRSTQLRSLRRGSAPAARGAHAVHP